jgi:hypothetical protein
MLKLLLIVAVLTCSAAVSSQTATTLSLQQIEGLKAAKVKTEKQAVPYALKMAVTVKKIYDNMLSAHEDQRLRRKLAARLHLYTGKLLDIRGQSYRDALGILTPAQRQTIREALKKPDAPQDIGELIAKTFGLAK